MKNKTKIMAAACLVAVAGLATIGGTSFNHTPVLATATNTKSVTFDYQTNVISGNGSFTTTNISSGSLSSGSVIAYKVTQAKGAATYGDTSRNSLATLKSVKESNAYVINWTLGISANGITNITVKYRISIDEEGGDQSTSTMNIYSDPNYSTSNTQATLNCNNGEQSLAPSTAGAKSAAITVAVTGMAEIELYITSVTVTWAC
jgi:hypothetical protein